MPYTFRVYPDAKLVAISFWGQNSVDQSIGLLKAYSADPLANPSFDYLVDFSAVTDHDITFHDMMAHVSRLRDAAPPRDQGAKTSMIAPGDVSFGIARMFQSLADTQMANEVGVFRTRSEALAFLGRDDFPGLDLSPPLP